MSYFGHIWLEMRLRLVRDRLRCAHACAGQQGEVVDRVGQEGAAAVRRALGRGFRLTGRSQGSLE